MMWNEMFAQLRCLVIGDIMLDQYLKGSSDRRSPEADVPILSLQERTKHPGGAANVALNLVDFCDAVELLGVVGDDDAGASLIQLVEESGVGTSGIYRSSHRMTTVKTRLMSGSKHLLRVDDEVSHALSDEEEGMTLSLIKQALDRVSPQVVIMQDYNKGLLTPTLIGQVLEWCSFRGVSVTVDPKFNNIDAFVKVALFKPNFKELQAMVPMSIDRNLSDLDAAASHLHELIGFERLMVTLSDAGIYYCEKGEGKIVPTETADVVDVCGAGDAVIAMASMGLVAGIDMEEIVLMCNRAGGIVCGFSGVQPLTRALLKP